MASDRLHRDDLYLMKGVATAIHEKRGFTIKSVRRLNAGPHVEGIPRRRSDIMLSTDPNCGPRKDRLFVQHLNLNATYS